MKRRVWGLIRSRVTADRNRAANLIQSAARLCAKHRTTAGRIAHMAGVLGWSESRTRHIWYRDAAVIAAYEMDQLRRCIAKHRKRQAKSGKLSVI